MGQPPEHVRHGIGAVRPYVHGPGSAWNVVRHDSEASGLERSAFGPKSFHMQATIDDCVLVLETGDLPHPEGTASSIYVYVPDVDAAYRRAGARSGVDRGARGCTPGSRLLPSTEDSR